MAERIWTGEASGAFATAGNWSPATVPVTGDDVVFNEDGNVAMDGSDQSAVVLNSFTVGEGYTKDIASHASHLIIGGTNFVHRGKGTIYIESSISGVTDMTVAFTGSLETTAASLYGMFISTRTFSRLIVSRGVVSAPMDEANRSPFITSLLIVGSESQLTFEGGANGITTAWISDNGFLNITDALDLSAFLTTAHVNGGRLDNGGRFSVSTAAINVSGNGLVNWNTDVVLTEANIYDGTLDLTQTTEAKTVTTVNLWPDGKIKYDKNLTTFTNPINEFDGRTTDIG